MELESLEKEIKELKEENEQLKTQNLKVEEILNDFVDYCNNQPRTSRADHLTSLVISYLYRDEIEED